MELISNSLYGFQLKYILLNSNIFIERESLRRIVLNVAWDLWNLLIPYIPVIQIVYVDIMYIEYVKYVL